MVAADSTKTLARPQAYSPSRSGSTEYIPEGARLHIHIDTTPTSPNDSGETAFPAWTEASPKDSPPPLNDNSVKGRESAEKPPKAASTPALGHASDLDSNTDQQGVKVRVMSAFKGQSANVLHVELDEMVLAVQAEYRGQFSSAQDPVFSQSHSPSFLPNRVTLTHSIPPIGWCLVKNNKGELGWVPTSYLDLQHVVVPSYW